MTGRRLLFVSNLFPDRAAPVRGLDNATLLHTLSARWSIAVLAPRPVLPWQPRGWCPRPEDESLHPCYVPSLYVPKVGSRLNHRLMARALRPALPKADVVLSSWLYPDACAVARLLTRRAVPQVAIAQGSDVHQYLRHRVRRRLILEMSRSVRAIVTRSAELARLLEEAGVEPGKARPIYNGIDQTLFRPAEDRAHLRAELGWPSSVPVALFVGNFYPIKNPLVLLAAFARVPRECRLVLIGGGPLEGEMRSAVARLGLSGRVEFAGSLSSPQVARRMQAADLLVLPSRNEGVPNVILEAFGCGLPVVASQVGGIAEVHTGESCGRLVPAGDIEALAEALTSVLAQPPDRALIAARGASFTWERTAREYETVLTGQILAPGE